MDYKSKPFISSPEEQLKLVKDLSWVDSVALDQFIKDMKDIFNQNPLLDDIRISKIISTVERRIAIVLQRKKELM